jgi:hypothetical protein
MLPNRAGSIQKTNSVRALWPTHRTIAQIAPRVNAGSEAMTSHHLIFGSRILCLEKSKASMLRPACHQKNYAPG